MTAAIAHNTRSTPRAAAGSHRSLRRLNATMGTLHALSGAAMLWLSNDFSLDVTARFADGPPGQSNPPVETLFALPLGPAIAAFLLMSAAAHFALVVPWGHRWYAANLARGMNPARWIEYAFSASLMLVIIALLPGITDVTALAALFALNAAMILFGWLMEKHNQTTPRTDWTAFVFGSIVGVVPWAIVGFQIAGAGSDVPGFVYGIFASIFVLFNVFAVNMLLQYKRVGPWRDYLFGERVYILLSLTAKSALAWQIFANTLVVDA